MFTLFKQRFHDIVHDFHCLRIDILDCCHNTLYTSFPVRGKVYQIVCFRCFHNIIERIYENVYLLFI